MTYDHDDHHHHHNATEIAELTADVVSAYVRNNPLPANGLPDLIASVHASLSGLGSHLPPTAQPKEPAVTPKRSVTPNFIYCLEDGKKFRSLRRHLRSAHGMTPETYRAKWDLPSSYPMTAPKYSAIRSALAKAAGLGKGAPGEEGTSERKAKA
jgi:predicted transcriptional regulator